MNRASKKIKVFFIEDHHIFLDSLIYLFKDLPDFEISGYALNKFSAEKKLRKLPVFPDIIICDYCLPNGTGCDLIKTLKQYNRSFKYVFLTFRNDREIIKSNWEQGCDAFILKNQSIKEIKQAIYDVMNNKRYLSPELVDSLRVNSQSI